MRRDAFDATQDARRRRRLAVAVALLCPILAGRKAFAQLGVPISTPAALNTNATTDTGEDKSGSLETDGAGNWVAVWQSKENLGGTIGVDEDLLVARSTDNGATWTAPQVLNTNAATDTGEDKKPFLATDSAGNWLVVWESEDALGGTIGTDKDILIARSTDNGATWTAPQALNTNAATDASEDDDKRPLLVTDTAGNWVAVWESEATLGGTIGDDKDILVSRSADNGATWSAPQALNANAATDGDSDDDEDPSVATDGAGNWVAAWSSEDTLGGAIGDDKDILVARSTDNGATWSAIQALNSNASTDGDSDDDEEPSVATDGAGNWLVAWSSENTLGGTVGTDGDVLVAQSADNGATWTAPQALNTNAATDSGDDDKPFLLTDGAGEWIAVWKSEDDLGGTIGEDDDILVARSTNNGTTWTAPQALNTNATTDSSEDGDAILATDGAGKWVAAWKSEENLGGTIGTDKDILVARFSFTAGVTLAESSGATSVNESGPTSDTYTLVLNTQPTADVTITVDPDSQTDLGAGAGNAVNLVFTNANWNVVQTVTVTAVDDSVVEGAHTSTITHAAGSADGNYNGITIANVTANVTDNDAPGVTLAESSGATSVNESGSTSDTYTLVLNTQPTADVTITVDPDSQTDLGAGGGNAVNLVFTNANWNVAQTVTVTAVDDSVAEGAHTSTITHAAGSADGNYNGITIADITVTISDDDVSSTGTVSNSGYVTAPIQTESDAEDGDSDAEDANADSQDEEANAAETDVKGIDAGSESQDAGNVEDGAANADPKGEIMGEGDSRGPINYGNQRPVADAGDNVVAFAGDTVSLSGENSFDPDGDTVLTFVWTQTDGSLVMAEPVEAVSIEFTAPDVEGSERLTFKLDVSDQGNPPLTSAATVTVTVFSNRPPVAAVGPDQDVRPGDVVVLSAADSYDPDEDLPLHYVWKQVEGPGVTEGSVEGERLEWDAPTAIEGPTTLVFELSVTDSGTPPRTDKARVRVKVMPGGGVLGESALCGAGVALPLAMMMFVSLCVTRRGRTVVRSGARMLMDWVADACRGRTFDPDALGKRRHPRWSWSRRIMIRFGEDSRSHRVATADVSEGGIRIWFPHRLNVGQTVELGVGDGGPWLRGRVVHVEEQSNASHRYHIGIELEGDAGPAPREQWAIGLC